MLSPSIAKRSLLVSAAVCAVAVAMPAQAQTTPSANASAASDRIEEIVVTARKREETVRDIPIAVTAFGAAKIQDTLSANITDIAQFTPGLQIQPAFGRQNDRPVIRGASNILSAEGKVGVFLDGIPYFGDFSTLDIESAARVEVIRGPQSAVFGRGTLSGAINVVTKKPTDEFTGRLAATVGSYKRAEIGGFVSGPLGVDWLRGQANFKFSNVDGQYKNQASAGGTVGGERSGMVSAALFATPTKDINASLRFIKSKDRDEHYAVWLLPRTSANCYLTTRPFYCGDAPNPPKNGFAINTDKLMKPGLTRDSERWFGSVDWDLMGSGYVLSYQAGVNKTYSVIGVDQSYDNRDFFIFNGACAFVPVGNQDCAKSPFNTTDASRRTTVTHEARLSSPSDQRLRWRVGAFYALDHKKPLAEYLEATESGLDSLGDATRVRDMAYFAGGDLDILSNLTLALEVRRQEEDVRATTLSYVASQYFSPSYLATLRVANPSQVIGTPLVRNATFKATLPRATLTWKVSPSLTAYAQYSEGNSPGGFNPSDAPQPIYQEEKLKNSELGIKTNLFGFDYLNISAYVQKYENQILTNTYLQNGSQPQSYKNNIGNTKTKGVEVEASRSLLTPDLKLNLTYSYTDAEFQSGVDPEEAVIRYGILCTTGTTANPLKAGCPAGAASVAGMTPPLVSKHLASVGLRYQRDLGGNWTGFTGADLIYRSRFYAQTDNLISVANSTRINLQMGVKNHSGLRITAWGKNVGNDRTPVGVLRYVDLAVGTPKAPSGSSQRAFAITPSRLPEYGLTLTQSF